MSLPIYPEYKDSGIEWSTQLPAHWGVACLKWICQRYSGGTPDKSNIQFWEDGTIPWLNSGAVNDGRIYEPSALITQEAFENSSAKWIPSGALVMALAGQGKTKGMVAQLMFESTCNQSMAAIVPGNQVVARFLYWWLVSNYQNIRNMAGGDLRDGLNLDLLGEIPCPLPLSGEQVAIAKFLDRETAKIDALIAEQETLLALLAEKRQATISHAVTRGLDPTVPMKDSGIVWLGEVPAHWETSRLKYVTDAIVDCPHSTPIYDDAGDYLVIRTADLSRGVLTPSAMYRVMQSHYQERTSRSILMKNDIVYGREGERWGHAALVPETDRYCLGQRMMQFRPSTGMCSSFLMWQLNSIGIYRQGDIDTVGATSPHVNVSTIRNFELTVPPIEEQKEIATYLDAKASRFDLLQAGAMQAIEVLRERCSALIAAAVTGKIDVRSQVKAQAA